PYGVLEQDVEPEADSGNDAEDCEHAKTSQVNGDYRLAARLEPTDQEREARTKEERERPPGLLLEQYPDRPADQILGPLHYQPQQLVEVDDQHTEQREAAQDVEAGDALVIRGPGVHEGGESSESGGTRHQGTPGCPAGGSRLR